MLLCCIVELEQKVLAVETKVSTFAEKNFSK
jgi:hypothetical protein